MPCRHPSEGAHKHRPSAMPRMQRRKSQLKTLAPKGKEQSQKIKLVTIPGQVVSVDQLASYTPGLISTHQVLPTTKRYSGATVFVDHASHFTYVHLMEVTSDTAKTV